MGREGYPYSFYKKLQEIVIKYNPEKIIDFGTWKGTTSKSMAKVSKGRVITYDFGKIEERTEGNITYKYGDFYEWIQRDTIEDFDLLYVDVHNTGKVIKLIKKHLDDKINSGIPILFEGGILDRDGNRSESEWMKTMEPMYPLKDILNYEVLVNDFPGLSMFKQKE